MPSFYPPVVYGVPGGAQAYSAALTTYSAYPPSAYFLTLTDDVDAATARSTLELGTTDSPTFAGLTVSGNLVVSGEVIEASATVTLQQQYIYQSTGYTTNSARTAGVVRNYLPSSTSTTASAFVPGVAAVSNPLVTVASTAGFAAGDIILVSGSTNNDGFWEVDGTVAGPARLRVKGVGTVATVEDWPRNQFLTEVPGGTVTVVKAAVSVVRTGIDGVEEHAHGSTVPMTYSDVVTFSTLPAGTSVTTKGDLQTFTTVPARLAAGADGYILTADSTTSTGLRWAVPAVFVVTVLPWNAVSTGGTSNDSVDIIATQAGTLV